MILYTSDIDLVFIFSCYFTQLEGTKINLKMRFMQTQNYEEIIKNLPHFTLQHSIACTYLVLNQFVKVFLTTGNILFPKACKLFILRDDLQTASFQLLIPIFTRSS